MLNAIRKAVFGDNTVRLSKDLIEIARETEAKFTPDLAYLEQFAQHRLFVIDLMMKGGICNPFLGNDAEYKSVAFTKNDFDTYKKDLGFMSYHVPLHPEEEQRQVIRFGEHRGPAPIRGEIHAVRPWIIKLLDDLSENGVKFTRRRVRLLVPTKRRILQRERVLITGPNGKVSIDNKFVETSHIYETRAWMYIGVREYWGEMIADSFLSPNPQPYLLGPAKIYKPNNPQLRPFSFFNKYELKK